MCFICSKSLVVTATPGNRLYFIEEIWWEFGGQLKVAKPNTVKLRAGGIAKVTLVQ